MRKAWYRPDARPASPPCSPARLPTWPRGAADRPAALLAGDPSWWFDAWRRPSNVQWVCSADRQVSAAADWRALDDRVVHSVALHDRGDGGCSPLAAHRGDAASGRPPDPSDVARHARIRLVADETIGRGERASLSAVSRAKARAPSCVPLPASGRGQRIGRVRGDIAHAAEALLPARYRSEAMFTPKSRATSPTTIQARFARPSALAASTRRERDQILSGGERYRLRPYPDPQAGLIHGRGDWRWTRPAGERDEPPEKPPDTAVSIGHRPGLELWFAN